MTIYNDGLMLVKKFFKRSNLRSISIYLLIVGIIILIVQVLHINAGKEIISEVNRNQLMLINEIAYDLEYLMKDVQEKVDTLARLYPIQRLEPRQVLNDLKIYRQLMHHKISYIGIMNSQGRYKYFYPRITRWEEMRKKDFSKADFFQDALRQLHDGRGQVPYISNQYDQGFGITAIPVSLPLYTDEVGKKNTTRVGKKNTAGEDGSLEVLVLFLDINVIDDLCQNHYCHIHDYSSFWLIDDQGNFLSHENESWISKSVFQVYKEKSPKRSSHSLNWIIREKMLKGTTGTEVYLDVPHDPRGTSQKCYLNYAPVRLSGRNWSIAVTTPAVKMDHWERRVLKSAWQWLLFIISFVLVALSFVQVVIILIHKKRINWEKEQREKFQSAFDGITDLVYMIDVDYKLQIVNKAFMKLCGQSEKEIEGKKCFQFIKAREVPCPDCPIPKTKLTNKTQRSEQVIFQETANLYAYPLIDREREITATVIFARIITKEKILEQELQHRERLSILGELAACITHEIKNPLVGIAMLTELVRDSLPAEGACAEDLERILKECHRLEQLINNLSRFSQPAPLSFEKGDIHKSLELSLALLKEKLKKKGTQVQTIYQADIPPVPHDAQKMQQVFLNLMINSINAMPEGGRLIVRTYLLPAFPSGGNNDSFSNDGNASFSGDDNSFETSGPVVCLDIQDTGTGIPLEMQNRIFDPFFSTCSNGTGLGLYIVHSIIQQHNGQIRLKSQPGQGTLITICLPLRPPEAQCH
jgi:PAS domain S-box-containing protein